MPWKIAQSLVWLLGTFILGALLFEPQLGIHLLWNILIPIAPLFLVVATGFWRNICPLATTALLPQRLGFSKKEKLRLYQEGYLGLIGVCALLLIVPLRHLVFNLNGPATALLIVALVLVALIAGSILNSKSAWCSGLCPVHPVEKLYGMRNRFSFSNAHCESCCKCVAQCPDANAHAKPFPIQTTRCHRLAGLLMVGGFPGYVWGWFHVPDTSGIPTMGQVLTCYGLPLLGLVVSCAIFLLARCFFRAASLHAIFSATAVSFYYWYRLPALFGFGLFPQDGILIDLTSILHPGYIHTIALALSLFFFWWLVLSPPIKQKWLLRPAYAKTLQPPT